MKPNKQPKLAAKVLIRRVALFEDKWFGTVRIDYGDIYDYRVAEQEKYYTFCYDTMTVDSKTAAKKLAKEFCEMYGLRIKRYVF